MAFKLKISKKASEIFDRIESSENLPCYTLVKLAMALSLRSKEPLKESDFHTNSLGRESYLHVNRAHFGLRAGKSCCNDLV